MNLLVDYVRFVLTVIEYLTEGYPMWWDADDKDGEKFPYNHDIHKAVKFLRKEDAEKIQQLLNIEDVVTGHIDL